MWLVGIDEAEGTCNRSAGDNNICLQGKQGLGTSETGVKDSKLLSSKKRIELSKMLSENESFYSETAVMAHEIDNL